MEKDISFKFTITEKILPVLVNIICYNPTLKNLHFEFANVRIESDMFAVRENVDEVRSYLHFTSGVEFLNLVVGLWHVFALCGHTLHPGVI